MKQLVVLMVLTLSLYSGTFSANGASLSASSNVFSKNSVSVGIKLGSASIGNENYTILGLSGNYFVIDNLSVGLGYEKWLSGNPDIQKATVESTYFIPASEAVRPYIGLFYRRIMIGDGLDDVNAYGYRAGVAFVQKRLIFSAGIVQERYESDRAIFNDTQTYMEAAVGITF
jgi:hypothetical protein